MFSINVHVCFWRRLVLFYFFPIYFVFWFLYRYTCDAIFWVWISIIRYSNIFTWPLTFHFILLYFFFIYNIYLYTGFSVDEILIKSFVLYIYLFLQILIIFIVIECIVFVCVCVCLISFLFGWSTYCTSLWFTRLLSCEDCIYVRLSMRNWRLLNYGSRLNINRLTNI